MIFFPPGRTYDPSTGRWTAPDYQQLMVNLNDVVNNPGIVNLYQNYAIVNKNVHHNDYKTGNVVNNVVMLSTVT